jgi:predicted peptidase
VCTTIDVAKSGTYTIQGIDGFKYYTNNPSSTANYSYPVVNSGGAFVCDHCFDELSGKYMTVNQSYALYVPADYEQQGAANKKFALVTMNHPATSEATHPYEVVIQSRAPAFFASDKAQQIVKDTHGLGGLIVVVPSLTARVGDNIGTPAGSASLVKLWDDLQKRYVISEDHIYGAGQSVGGMNLLETNVKRDNYFAGILLYDNQWGQDYYKDQVFVRNMMDPTANMPPEAPDNTPRHYPSTDGDIIWDYHWGDDRTKVYEGHDPNNYYYLTSDDNILITHCEDGNPLALATWTEQNWLYRDLAGYSIPKFTIDDFSADKDEQNAQLRSFLASNNRQGIWWFTIMSHGNFGNMQTPVMFRSLDATYEWLLTQTRVTEMARQKLDLDKPFELAVSPENREMTPYRDPDGGGPISYKTAKPGSGTQFYNSAWLNLGNSPNKMADKLPGWLPGNLQHPVRRASIVNVEGIDGGDGSLAAIAIEYDVDMEHAVIWREGDHVLDSHGIPRASDFVIMETFDFYDVSNSESPVEISATINKIYINGAPALNPSASGCSEGTCQGSGNYVIVEFNTGHAKPDKVGVAQRATVITDKALAMASPIIYR